MIYLDYQATTPIASEVAQAMRPWIERDFANPHSAHRMGREAAAAIHAARMHVAVAIGTTEAQTYFTSGATEAANWALKGAASRCRRGDGDRRRRSTPTRRAGYCGGS